MREKEPFIPIKKERKEFLKRKVKFKNIAIFLSTLVLGGIGLTKFFPEEETAIKKTLEETEPKSDEKEQNLAPELEKIISRAEEAVKRLSPQTQRKLEKAADDWSNDPEEMRKEIGNPEQCLLRISDWAERQNAGEVKLVSHEKTEQAAKLPVEIMTGYIIAELIQKSKLSMHISRYTKTASFGLGRINLHEQENRWHFSLPDSFSELKLLKKDISITTNQDLENVLDLVNELGEEIFLQGRSIDSYTIEELKEHFPNSTLIND